MFITDDYQNDQSDYSAENNQMHITGKHNLAPKIPMKHHVRNH